MSRNVEFGVFLPVGQGGFVMSTNRPPTPATYEHNRKITVLAEELGLGFVISLAQWRGFGGPSAHGENILESVSTMAGLAEATSRIRLFATMHTMVYHPAVAAKIVTTIDQMSGGRFGLNLVAGSNPIDHGQMGIWRDLPHDELYELGAEWMTVAKRLWTEGRVDYEGHYYQLADCVSDPKPLQRPHPPVICAATSDRGMQFTMQYCDASLVNGTDLDDLKVRGRRSKEIAEELGQVSRVVGLFMLVPAETDAEAHARVDLYNEGADETALTARAFQYSKSAKAFSKSENLRRQMRHMRSEDGAQPIAVSKSSVVGSVDTCVDQIADVVEAGQFDWICLYMPDYLADLEIFGCEILPRLADKGIAPKPGTYSSLVSQLV
jgi:pyrimidine oxygenase